MSLAVPLVRGAKIGYLRPEIGARPERPGMIAAAVSGGMGADARRALAGRSDLLQHSPYERP